MNDSVHTPYPTLELDTFLLSSEFFHGLKTFIDKGSKKSEICHIPNFLLGIKVEKGKEKKE